jgi:hypothetical protein
VAVASPIHVERGHAPTRRVWPRREDREFQNPEEDVRWAVARRSAFDVQQRERDPRHDEGERDDGPNNYVKLSVRYEVTVLVASINVWHDF